MTLEKEFLALGIMEKVLAGAGRVQNEIRDEWPRDTSRSAQGIEVERGGDKVSIVATEDYSQYIDNINPSVEYVRKPNGKMPPLSVIAKWAKRKGLPPESVFGIAMSIAKKGVKNKKIFYRASKNFKI